MAVGIPLPKDEDLDPEVRDLLAILPPLNLFRMLANAPASIKEFLDMGASILMRSAFDPRKRVADFLDEEIEKIACDGPVSSLDEEGNLLCRVAEEISRDVRLSDEALAQILERYGNQGATELILCCCWFNLAGRFTESARVGVEEG